MLLKIGKRYVNMDNVTSIHDSVNYEGAMEMRIYFNVVNGDSTSILPDYEWFKGEEADALRSYLNSMAVDVLAVYAEKNKPDCATCGDTGVTAVRNGDDDTPCSDCTKSDNNREIPY